MTPPTPQYAHLARLSDARGLFEHARYADPRPEHGYCTDDVARGLLATIRTSDSLRVPPHLMTTYLGFLEQAIGSQGRAHNRMSVSGTWTDEPGAGDWWGRAVWALGVASTTAPVPSVRSRAARAFDRAARQAPVHLHAAAFATLGAGPVLRARPGHGPAERIVRRFAEMVTPGDDTVWPWPEARLRYGNGSIAEATILAGVVLGDDAVRRHGLRLLRFLLDTEVRNGRLSVTGVGGRGPGEHGPQFDQQPIEVAAIADACARAFAVTGDPAWLDGIRLAWSWFEGDNDSGVPMVDLATGAGFDGLEPAGRNQNRGAESTLAALSTWQHAVALPEARVAA
ncbi:glycosyltransferase [uncultured Amnibacterium sp.]|uniref:glycosyltransferase n=1 Tax=uncultured Amnibacterium sp. TaxID=1631851 RepID=UPI0035CC41C0